MLSFVIFLQNYETSESKIKREFESYGPIKRVGIFEHSDASSVRGYRAAGSLVSILKSFLI